MLHTVIDKTEVASTRFFRHVWSTRSTQPSISPGRPVSRRRFSPSPAGSVLSHRQPMHIG